MSKAAFHRNVFLLGVGGAVLLVGVVMLRRQPAAGEDPGYLASLEEATTALPTVEDAQQTTELESFTPQVQPERQRIVREVERVQQVISETSDAFVASREAAKRRAAQPSVWS